MDAATLLVLFSLFHFYFIDSVDSTCPNSFHCGDQLGNLEFPLSDFRHPECGLFMVDCTDSTYPRIQLGDGGTWYRLIDRVSTNNYKIQDPSLQHDLSNSNLCLSLRNLSLPNSPSSSLTFFPNLTLFICGNDRFENATVSETSENYKNYSGCGGFKVYYRQPTDGSHTGQSSIFQGCTVVHMPIKSNQETGDLLNLLSAEFTLEWNVSAECNSCHRRRGQCLANSLNEFQCKEGKNPPTMVLAAAISGGSVFIVLCLFLFFVIYNRKKRNVGAYLLSRNKSFGPFSKSGVEGGSFNFEIAIFSYTELVEATNNFESSKELGDGGYGTVYYGKLRDGREVAIKRLYEHNYRRVEQFRNEIKILTCLRHPNLVSLYGCTSRKSRELLLVYEFVPNGTVGDHLHGESAKKALLTWDIRMNIAIETASALAYLHKSDIIHRDVKTNNILLDKSFCVKVADFGLSRLFPIDVTHISTAPQGTPGYVDPEYYQCYQLTDKSDVYSFGVVLVELISSMPAVDISRHKHEINLSNFAVNKIQKSAFDELMDSSLGYGTDTEVTRMTTSVAELAFQCLQLDKEFRPSMYEVLEVLMAIRNGEAYKFEKTEDATGNYSVPKSIPPSPETDDIVLLKNKNFQSSPTAVTDIWISGSTTSSIG